MATVMALLLAVCVVLVLGVAVQPGSAGAQENPLRLIRHERATTLIGSLN